MKPRIDWPGGLLLPLFMLAALPFMSPSTWLTLTVAGAAMGMMLFLMASGLTLIFGLMDVITFAHGAFISLGAYTATAVVAALPGMAASQGWAAALALLALALMAAILAGLATNYTSFLAPRLALGSSILLMVALLLWRPRGLFSGGR